VNGPDFEQVVDRQYKMCWTTLVEKAREYADDQDRLRNFKIAAGLQGSTPRQALGGMLAKHLVSIFDLINEVECAPTPVWDEKLTDAMNYLLLLRAITVEELSLKSNQSTTVAKVEVVSDAP
jgi:hypothetical protein